MSEEHETRKVADSQLFSTPELNNYIYFIADNFQQNIGGSYELRHFILQWMAHFKADGNSSKRHVQCKHTVTLTQGVSRLRIDTLGNSCRMLYSSGRQPPGRSPVPVHVKFVTGPHAFSE